MVLKDATGQPNVPVVPITYNVNAPFLADRKIIAYRELVDNDIGNICKYL